MTLYFPVPQWNKQSYREGMRQFRWRRPKGRIHAGCDLYAPLHSPVIAITDGIVVENARFYNGTFQLSVSHPEIGVVRYGEIVEIPKDLAVGEPVTGGIQIGKIGKLVGMSVHPMLHFELFAGTSKGSLTNLTNKTNYTYVTPGNFLRRSDLKDPSSLLDQLVREGKI